MALERTGPGLSRSRGPVPCRLQPAAARAHGHAELACAVAAGGAICDAGSVAAPGYRPGCGPARAARCPRRGTVSSSSRRRPAGRAYRRVAVTMSLLRSACAAAGCAAMVLATQSAVAAQARRAPFGTLSDGTRIESVELTSRAGIRARVITLGARIQSLDTPDRNGRSTDIVLGFPSPQQYFDDGNYFGATVGRFANRIAKGRFTLDGHTYQLTINDHGNSLHGGTRGLDKRVWKIDSISSGKNASVVMSYLSPDGEEGYPGTLHATATYTLSDDGELRIDYRATTDKPTIVNFSGHSYFNLASSPDHFSTMRDLLQINASRYTPVDEVL